MRSRFVKVLAAAAWLVATPAWATDGHFLHGVGAVNSAMGGIGVAAPSGLLGAFYVNPASLVRFHGTQTELGFEMFKPDRTISSRYGDFAGSTRSSSEFTPIPAFGWSRELRANKLTIGVAGIGVGGFGVDYHTDMSNPILAPRPNGFGEVFSSFSLMKIIPALGYKVSDRLQVGIAANLDWASLAVDPMPIAAPAVDPGPDGQWNTPDDRAFYSRATDADGSYGIGGQLGLQYQFAPDLWLGLAYTSPQAFGKFEYGGVYENPNLANYGQPRTIRFAMDVPAVYGGGLAWTPFDALTVGADVKYITYESTRGFRKSGFDAQGAVRGFGWKNIATVSTGFELKPNPRTAVRAGYNYSQNPVPNALTMFNAPAPAIVRNHVTFGAGYMFTSGFGVNAAYYHAFKASIEGPMLQPSGAVPGTSVKSSMSEHSILLGVTYNPLGDAR